MIVEESAVSAPARVVVFPVPYTRILDSPNFADLCRAYAAACIVPDAEPQRPLYDAMAQAGVLHCFGAYAEFNGAPLLVGFGSVICGIVPHDGHLVASLESLFVYPEYRSTGAGNMLLAAIEQCASDRGCRCFVAQARVGSVYDKVLSRRTGYTPTHTQYTKWLNGYKGGRA